MSDEPRQPRAATDSARRRDHLHVVVEPPVPIGGASARPKTIGRLIAQTALIADSAVTRRRATPPGAESRGMGRILGRFR